MFQPRIPTNPAPTGEVIPVYTPEPLQEPHPGHAPTNCFCRHDASSAPNAVTSRPAVQITPGSVIALVGGGIAVVLVVGVVLVSMLLAVAVTAGSLAVLALVIRSLMNGASKHGR
ncbi:hypothetical protein [Streptomyces kanamyceticus]|uniref:SpdD-like protein n=1 Tax=Streptomyces kanamyceticus TaxID=1967 RepID=A0A5J6GL78_STRKN|nr:hypothetical protein [Streptomyces kanamyceticus]QEU95164.1 SpdD-like protein [Streptomyces kanamyceticus]